MSSTSEPALRAARSTFRVPPWMPEAARSASRSAVRKPLPMLSVASPAPRAARSTFVILGLSYVLMAKLRPVPAASGGNLPVFLLDFF